MNSSNESNENRNEELSSVNIAQTGEKSIPEVNNNYVESEKTEIVKEENIKVKKSPVVPIILSILVLLSLIPFVKDAFFVEHEGLSGLSVVGDILFLYIGFGVLCLTWIIYLILLAIAKKKNKEKKWWTPVLIIILIIIVPRAIIFGFQISQNLKSNPQIFTNAHPEIKSYDKLNDMPIYKEYKVLGKDINEYDVYNNIDKYKNTKVLVQGIPSYRGDSGTSFGNTVNVNIFNENYDDMLLYRFTFVDKSSEFSKDSYIFFATENTSLDDYYTYIYGEIISVQTNSSGGNDYKIINIKPEKIYYTLKWDTMFIKDDEIVYSTCAKVGNKCSDEQILDGQIVNVSVNNTTNLDFYVINDDGQNLVLYGYKALATTPYLSESDTKKLLKENKESRYKYDDSIDYYMYNYWGPYTLIKKLNELTSSWTNIPPIKEYSYYTKEDNIFKSFEIKNGVSSITSFKGNKVTIPGTSVARIASEKEISNDYNAPEFYGKSCLKTIGIRDGSNCDSWIVDEGVNGRQFGVSISANYTKDKYTIDLVTSNIHEKNYLVPVIEIPKTLVNE